KITPAHDENDYKIGMEHNLEVIDIFNDNGTLNKKAQLYVGKDRFAVRTEIVADLQNAGFIVKIEDYTNKVGYSERTHVVIEPKLSTQWFLKMKEITAPALANVMNDEIEFFPKKFKNVYRHWMENIKDWCISRQLWWGHQIPVYYLPDGSHVCAATIEEALQLAQQKTGNTSLTIADLRQDEDVLDTWASSWLWPISVFGGITNPNNKEINYYYPTNVLVTGHDIIFFWVARMIMTGYEYRKTYPFKHVYFTGMVRDKLRRKMSKSLGNSPEPLELIEKYGADGVRVGMLLCSPAGGDLLYDDALPEQGRNFSSKIWNAFRLVQGWNVDNTIEQPAYAKAAIEALTEKIKEASIQLDEQFEQYRLSEAMMTVYKLFWDELSAWYLEIVKPEYGKPIDGATYTTTIQLFESILQLLHPFMPFITEEVWHYLKPRGTGESIMISQIPTYSSCNTDLLVRYERIKEVVAGIRGIRKDKQVPFKETIELHIKGIDAPQDFEFVILAKLGNISAIHITNQDISNAASFRVDAIEYFIPLAQSINVEEEKQKIQEELTYIQGFLASVDKKLMNEKFVSSAPAAVVETERKKKADALEKIELLEKRLKTIQG
ncbi:MAG TPA: class I tRNA ligase family protein, partial [Bacteroidales bacterium]|nr:class I tRNA ligase family protein [Bacteroidales bacterium]